MLKPKFKQCIVALALTTASPAFARDVEPPPRATVSYADLDIASPAGQAAFERRLASAIKRVCGANSVPTLLYEKLRIRKCHKEVSAAAARDFDLALARERGNSRLSTR